MPKEITKEQHNLLNEAVSNWMNMEDAIKDKSSELSDMRKQSKQLEDDVMDLFEKFGLTLVPTSSGETIEKTVTTTRGTIKDTMIMQSVLENAKGLKDVDKQQFATKVVETVETKRPENIKTKLKINKPKKTKAKK